MVVGVKKLGFFCKIFQSGCESLLVRPFKSMFYVGTFQIFEFLIIRVSSLIRGPLAGVGLLVSSKY